MNDAALYAKSNSFQRVATEKIIHEFSHLLQWQKNDSASILDIGCGTGDVTIDLVVPLLPSNFSRLIGCDISDEMIRHAQKYNPHPKVIYDRLDICGNVDEFIAEYGRVDHAVSFFCLHWARNQHAALNNIAKLLQPNGDCFLLFITSSNIYKVWEQISKSTEWSPYMKDVEQFLSPYYYSICPSDDLRVMLQDAGFSTNEITTRELKHLYKNYEEFASKLLIQNDFYFK